MSQSGGHPELPLLDAPTCSTSQTPLRRQPLLDPEARCSVCGAEADGVHYNAIACRSCTAFFRRSVTYKQRYSCRNNNDCPINQYDRCVCRSCRLAACFRAGMTSEAVRPQREPSGPQIRRNSRKHIKSSPTRSYSIDLDMMKHSPAYTDIMESPRDLDQSTDDQREFDRLVTAYSEHMKFMHRSMMTAEDFLEELTSGAKYSCISPDDLDKLASVELGGLIYWIEKIEPFLRLDAEDRDILFKRYSVRKLGLDHFYIASKHPEFAKTGSFMMNNNRFVPSYLTGFETATDTELSRKAKFRLLRPTIDLSLQLIVKPFYEMHISDEEIVTLHLLLLWSSSNNHHVQNEETRRVMKEGRDWAVNRLHRHYQQNDEYDPVVRLGEVILLLCEIEVLSNQHCRDFQVVQLFKCGKLDQYWYEGVCYSDLNIL